MYLRRININYASVDDLKMFEKLEAIDFADWINRNGYEPMAMFPLKDNKKWSCDDGATTKTTEQLYDEFIKPDVTRSKTWRAVELKWVKKFPIVKWWNQVAITIADNMDFVVTKGARDKKPFSLWIKSYGYKKSERFIGNFKTLTKAKKVAQLIYEG